jgi:hypothetical protein
MKAPPGLTPRSQRLWRAVIDGFELSDAEVELLRNGLVALDRADEAAADVAKHGVTVLDRYGSLKANPAADIEARNRALFAAIVRQLGVRVTVDVPLSAASRKAQRAARARWGVERAM